MAIVTRVFARNEDSTLSASYDNTPTDVGGGVMGYVATSLIVHNPTGYGFWVGVRHASGRTAQRIFAPQADATFNLPTGQASRFWFVIRPDGKLDGLIFETGYVVWTGATEKPSWP